MGPDEHTNGDAMVDFDAELHTFKQQDERRQAFMTVSHTCNTWKLLC